MSEAVAKRSEPKTIKDLIAGDQFRSAVQLSLPKHLSADRFVRVALTALTRQPKLQQCDQHSFFNCLMTLSQLGLEPDGRRAHLIPFGKECQLIVDYKGLVELVMRSGLVSNIHADIVCDNDDFEYDRGEIKKHKIDFKKPRGSMYAAYAIVKFKDGTEKSEVMSKDDIESVRKRSRASNNGPWVTDFSEMSKKTVFRRMSKWLTLSPELRDAVEADDESMEEQRFAAALAVGSSFELPPSTGPTFLPVKRAKPVPDDSGLSAVPVPENDPGLGRPMEGSNFEQVLKGQTGPTEAEVFPNLARNESTDIAGKADPVTTAPRTIQMDLQAEVEKVVGATFETFTAVAVALGWINADKPIKNYDELTDSTARKLYGARIGLAKALTEAVAKGIV